MASWTTTIVIVSTSVANDTIASATVVRMPSAASGPPVIHLGIKIETGRAVDGQRSQRQQHARGVVARVAVQGVIAGRTAERIDAGIAGDQVVQGIAGAADVP